jgi:hypothetical protein
MAGLAAAWVNRPSEFWDYCLNVAAVERLEVPVTTVWKKQQRIDSMNNSGVLLKFSSCFV